ncbi:cell surface protein [Enterococcus quebecensis]|uniref:Cell surface protein n=1 Tax=Enterococcus quebecensis TaxID=903983 RepID=A0A1E5GZH4_9ENTE|nr:cell surface protein [Enterococcus quebecensis]
MKRTKKLFYNIILILGILTIVQSVTIAQADTGRQSEVEVFFTENKDPTAPLNPKELSEPVEIISDIPIKPGTPGPLSVDFAPHVVFGEQDGSADDDVYFAQLTKVKTVSDGSEDEVPNYIQITDNRGKDNGWKLTVKQNGQLRNGDHTLTGAEMMLKNIKLISPNGNKEPIYTKDITLDPINSQPMEVSRSDEKTGKGTWIIMFGSNLSESKKSIQIKVPGDIEKKRGKYTTSLTWELVDSPI